jgi:hypothetical protein
MALAHYDSLKSSLKTMGKAGIKLINESAELKKEYDRELDSTKD